MKRKIAGSGSFVDGGSSSAFIGTRVSATASSTHATQQPICPPYELINQPSQHSEPLAQAIERQLLDPISKRAQRAHEPDTLGFYHCIEGVEVYVADSGGA